MKNLASILLIVLAWTANARATATDLVECTSAAGFTVTVTSVGGGHLDLQTVIYINGAGQNDPSYVNKTAEITNVRNFTLSATAEGQDSNLPGVIGRGVMLAVENKSGVLARNGLIERLTCTPNPNL